MKNEEIRSISLVTVKANSSVAANTAATRFIDLDRVMDSDEELIWRFNIGGSNDTFIYSNGNIDPDDYKWICTEYGDANLIEESKPVFQNHQFRYEITRDMEYDYNYDYDESTEEEKTTEKFPEFFEALRKFNVSILFKSSRSVVFESDRKLPVRVKSMFSIIYKGLMLAELKAEDETDHVSSADLKMVLSDTLSRYREFIKNCKMEANPHKLLVEDLDLSLRSYNVLCRNHIRTLFDIAELSEEDLRKLRGMGKSNAAEIMDVVAKTLGNKTPGEYRNLAILKECDKLNRLIGLDNVKNQVNRIVAYSRLKKDLTEKNIPGLSLNMVFKGNPGTAKTTVARILAGILYTSDILKSAEIVEVGRSELVGKYVGHTAKQVKDAFDRAEGKLLFIDEAYSLVGNGNDYGQEAITTIVQEMENRRDKTVVVFAGYPDNMDDFLNMNPGLKSRIPFHIDFEDYSVADLIQITEFEATNRGFTINKNAHTKISEICKEASTESDFGNGRFCRNLVENAIINYATRIYGSDSQQEGNFELKKEDFISTIKSSKNTQQYRIGFDVA